MTSEAKDRRAALGVALGAVCISFAPIFVKAVPPHALGPTAIAFHRMWIGGLALALVAIAGRQPLRPDRNVLFWATLAGVFFAGDLFVWHRSILRIGAGMGTILANTQVFWVAAFGALILRERVGPRLVAAIPAAVLGIGLLSGVLAGANAPKVDLVGVAQGLSTGLFYTGYLITLRRAQRDTGRMLAPVGFMVWVCAATALILALLSAAEHEAMMPPDLRTAALVTGLAVIAQAAGWTVLARNLPHVPISRSGLIILLQPTLATLWGAILFGERLAPVQLAGAAVTLGAIYVGATAGAGAGAGKRVGAG